MPADTLTSLDALQPFILPRTPGCPWPTALHHARQAAIQFFKDTLCWRSRLATTTAAGVNHYAIGLPSESSLSKLLSATVSGFPANVLNMEQGQRALQRPDLYRNSVWTEDRVNFFYSPTPASAGVVIELYVALKPSQDAASIPTSMFEQHAKAIADGALGSLLGMKDRQWHDPQGQVECQSRFDKALATVIGEASRGAARSTQRTAGDWF